ELSTAYNWGYDPNNYNVPEGKYSSDPKDPKARIRECKQMIQSLHEESIGVVMDVVFNHTAVTESSWFNKTVPNYYYRQDEEGNFADGSACGNEIASERKMMRKFIIDSILYWAKEYKIDGFRFDLMGLIDVETMNQLRASLDSE
ncbi:alpha-amylase family glycosyl hydrolase, partial [Enterococcus faecium]|uniref:alpha-amylase family glycosyl hydrolase n=1 Tax=Enterococcus faecium TaxID=1352 RepID=UPI0034E978BF